MSETECSRVKFATSAVSADEIDKHVDQKNEISDWLVILRKNLDSLCVFKYIFW